MILIFSIDPIVSFVFSLQQYEYLFSINFQITEVSDTGKDKQIDHLNQILFQDTSSQGVSKAEKSNCALQSVQKKIYSECKTIFYSSI